MGNLLYRIIHVSQSARALITELLQQCISISKAFYLQSYSDLLFIAYRFVLDKKDALGDVPESIECRDSHAPL